jgi:hypothetical protein
MDIKSKAGVVAECWMIVRNEEAWEQLIKYGDLGFPLAYAFTEGAIELNEQGENLVTEIYDVILASLNIPADEEYADFEAVLDKHLELFPPEDEEETKEEPKQG